MPTVLVTRAPRKAVSFIDALTETTPAAQVLCAPVLEAVPVVTDEWEETAFALIRGEFSWVTFTSVNGVLAFNQLAAQLGQSAASLLGAAQVAAVGQGTETALASLDVMVDFVPEEQSAAGMVAEWPLDDEEGDPAEETVLLVQGLTASETLEAGLTDYGYTAVTLGVYTMQLFPAQNPLVERSDQDGAALDLQAARQALGQTDVLVATSPLILETLVDGFEGKLPPVVAIGASTQRAAQQLNPAVRPEKILVAASPAPADLAAAVTQILN